MIVAIIRVVVEPKARYLLIPKSSQLRDASLQKYIKNWLKCFL